MQTVGWANCRSLHHDKTKSETSRLMFQPIVIPTQKQVQLTDLKMLCSKSVFFLLYWFSPHTFERTERVRCVACRAVKARTRVCVRGFFLNKILSGCTYGCACARSCPWRYVQISARTGKKSPCCRKSVFWSPRGFERLKIENCAFVVFVSY